MTAETPPQKLPANVIIALLVQTAIAAGTYLAARRATQDVAPLTLVTLRITLSAVLFALVLALLPVKPGGVRWPARRDWLKVAFFGLLAGPLNQGLFIFGLARSLASHAALLYALTPVGVYLVNVTLRREEAQSRRVIGIMVALVGVVVLLLGRGLTAATGPLVGDGLILLAVLAWVVFTTESRPFALEHGGIRSAGWSLVAAGLWQAPFLFVLPEEALARVTPIAWACLAWLVVLTSVASYALWNYALARVEASRVAVFSNLQPVATAIAAWLVLAEAPTWELFAGGALVILGVRFAAR